MREKQYDIFISYRREGGYDTAKHLNDLLVRDGYKVSFDIDTLRSGNFDTQLLERIDQCKDFILIVDEHAFDRTIDLTFNPNNDWLRCELAYALKKQKNIIPVFLAGVRGFPDNLPEDVIGIIKKNGPEYNRYYFNDFYEKLKTVFLTSKPHKNIRLFFVFAAVAFAVIAIVVLFVNRNPSVYDNERLVNATKVSFYTKINPDKSFSDAEKLFINVAARTPVYAVTYTEDTPILIGLVNDNVIEGEMPESKDVVGLFISLIRYHNENGVWIKDFSKKITFDKIIDKDDLYNYCFLDDTLDLFSASQQIYCYFHLSRSCLGNASANVIHDFIAINLMKGTCHFLEYEENYDSHYSDNGTLYKEDHYPKGIEELLTNKFLEQKNLQKINN